MQIFKFGGASVRDIDNIKNVCHIVKKFNDKPTLIVVSAMGDTTDKLVKLSRDFYNQKEITCEAWEKLKKDHQKLFEQFFDDPNHSIHKKVSRLFSETESVLKQSSFQDYDRLYDQIVPIGELISSTLLYAYFQAEGHNVKWIDARKYITTDRTHREARVQWEQTESNIRKDLPFLLDDYIIITQGFIGSTEDNITTTLGREGSDYSAAIFASGLNAESVTIWKDVPGVLNADPKWFDKTELIPELSYADATELTYYGATVIHPKTIKPLQNKRITLHVRSFIDLDSSGTVIRSTNQTLPIPSFIFKINQIQLNIQPRDFSFILEDNLSHIFQLCHQNRIKINMMHNTAIRFFIAIDNTGENVERLIKELKKDYKIELLRDLELITIRYYNQETIDRVLVGKDIIQQLQDNYTCQMLVKKKSVDE